MAECESCSTGGFHPQEMKASSDGRLLLGPCCQGEPGFDWGVSLSMKRGLEAFAQYGDLKLTFTKSPKELKELVAGIQ